MTGKVVNLRLARKQQKRAQKEQTAEQNRITFGLSKQQKSEANLLNEQTDRRFGQTKLGQSKFEQAKLDKDDGPNSNSGK